MVKESADLKRFKDLIEEHGQETGGWRGRITPGQADAATGPTVQAGRPTDR
ncbi:hypothetical protein [Streptomyces sp. NPDC002057]|uniref:hypothetical protein n=1 Tax=Streptomyces sp. NPDC002057 TaxID=3154664 RepID=UPI00333129DD